MVDDSNHFNARQDSYIYERYRHNQRVLWRSYLRRVLQQEWEELEQEIDIQRELHNWEAEPRLLSFLEYDNSFLTPWNWNPNIAPVDNRGGPATSVQMMRFALGSFFSYDLVSSSQHAKSKDISGTDAKLVSDDSADKKPKVGKGVENASKGFDVRKVADQKAKGKGVDEVSNEYEVERLMSGTLSKMDRWRQFERNAKMGAKGK